MQTELMTTEDLKAGNVIAYGSTTTLVPKVRTETRSTGPVTVKRFGMSTVAFTVKR